MSAKSIRVSVKVPTYSRNMYAHQVCEADLELSERRLASFGHRPRVFDCWVSYKLAWAPTPEQVKACPSHKRKAVCTSATVGKCARHRGQQILAVLDAKRVWATLPIERCMDCGAEGYPRLPANHRELCDSSVLDTYNCEDCGRHCYKTPGTIAKLCGSCRLLAEPEPEPERWGPPDDDGIPF